MDSKLPDHPERPVGPDDAAPFASFHGAWSASERQQIGQALEVVERRRVLRPLALRPLWMCYHITAEEDLYVASRFDLDVVVACSVLELRLELLDLAGAVGTFERSELPSSFTDDRSLRGRRAG